MGDIAKLGVEIDPSAAVSGGAKASQAATGMASAMETAKTNYIKAAKEMGAVMQKVGGDIVKAMGGVNEANAKAGSNKGFAKMATEASEAAKQAKEHFWNMLEGLGLMEGGFARIVGAGSGLIRTFTGIRMAAKGMGEEGHNSALSWQAWVGIVIGVVAVVGTLIIAFEHLKEAVHIAGQFEQLQIKLAMVSGSMEQAKHRLEELDEFADKHALELPRLVIAAANLDKFTRGAFSSEAALKMVGDAAAAADQKIDTVAESVARLYADLKDGAPATRAASQLSLMGVISIDTANKIERLAAVTNEGGRNFQQLWGAVVREMQVADGAMALRANSWEGLFVKLSSAWESLHRVMGEPIRDALRPFIESLTEMMEGMKTKAREFGEYIGGALTSLAAVVRVLGSEGGFGLTFHAAIDSAIMFLSHSLDAAGMMFYDWLERAAKNFVKLIEVVGTSAFWEKMGSALMTIGKEFVKSLGDDLAVLWKKLKGETVVSYNTPLHMGTNLVMPDKRTASGMPYSDRTVSGAAADSGPMTWDKAWAKTAVPSTDNQVKYAAAYQKQLDEINAALEKGKTYTLPGLANAAKDAAAGKKPDFGLPSIAEIKRIEDLKKDADKIHDEFTQKGDFSKITNQLSQLRDAGLLTEQRLSAAHTKLDADFTETIGRFQEMKDRGMITADEFSGKIEEVKVNYIKALNDMANLSPFDKLMRQWADLKNASQQFGVDVANSFSNNITKGLTDLVTGTKSAKEAFNEMAMGIIMDIVQMTIKLMVQYAIQSALGMVTGKSFAPIAPTFPAGVHHAGGEVGGAAGIRFVSAASFGNAPRFQHGGTVTSGERAIIAEAGEQVLTRDQARDIKNRMGEKPAAKERKQDLTIMNVLDMREVEQHLANNPHVILNIMAKNSGKMRRALSV